MPPSLPHHNPEGTPAAELLGASGDAVIMSFFNMEGAALALALTSYTQQELVEKLVAHARSSDAAVSQKGLAQLLTYLRSTAQISGRLAKATSTRTHTNADGSRTREVVQGHALTSRLSHSRPAPTALRAGELIPPSVPVGRNECSNPGPEAPPEVG